MNKKTFLEELKKGLTNVSPHDEEEALLYYEEMIDDKIEEGKKEKQIIKDLGSIDDIIKKIEENTTPKNKNNNSKRNRLILYISLSPFIILFLAILFLIILSAYMIVLSLYMVTLSLALVGGVYVVHFIYSLFKNVPFAIFELGTAFFGTGLFIFFLKASNTLLILLNKFTISLWKNILLTFRLEDK